MILEFGCGGKVVRYVILCMCVYDCVNFCVRASIRERWDVNSSKLFCTDCSALAVPMHHKPSAEPT